jgi:hypothetical protein
VALKRNSHIITQYLDQNIEFAVHGYTHIDYSQLPAEKQLAHLRQARQIFNTKGMTAAGFRSPYLRRSQNLHAAIAAAGFTYVSNQPIMWEMVDTRELSRSASAGYERAIEFYAPWFGNKRPSLPQLNNHLVEIPVSLPDDEILLDRFNAETNNLVETVWQKILAQTYQRGELFTIQLHPERIALCAGGLSAVLAQAQTLTPKVWFARLAEIAAWWLSRAEATIQISDAGINEYHIHVTGPTGATILARGVEINAPTTPWNAGYQQVENLTFTTRSPLRPFIGLSPLVSPKLISFLRQQGYVVETSHQKQAFSHYFDQTDFDENEQLSILTQIETSGSPLIRLGRWPFGAQSALAVTGDIDALTIWDYGLRLVGR